MSLLKHLEPKPEEDLYFAFKMLCDTLETERQKRRKRRLKSPVQFAWYEQEFEEAGREQL